LLSRYIVVALLVGTLQSAQPQDEVRAWQTRVGISEVFPLPADEHTPTWVELHNYGHTEVEIRRWSLHDKDGRRYVFPNDLPPIPPHGVVLVTFAGADSTAEEDREFAGDNTAHLYVREADALVAFRGKINECALYAGVEAAAEQMVDYVCWGEWEETPNSKAAEESGVWVRRGTSLAPAEPRPGDRVFQPGQSLGRVRLAEPKRNPRTGRVWASRSADWDIYIAQQASPGRPNTWPSPTALSPSTAIRPALGPLAFHCRVPAMICLLPEAEKQAWETHVQIARDAQMADLVADEVVPHEAPYYSPQPPLLPGKYYWRVRLVTETDATPWSPVTEFELVP